MEWFIEAMIAGGIYDLLKSSVVHVGGKLKETVKEVLKGNRNSFSDEECHKIAELLEKADERDLKTQEYFRAYLTSCEALQEILKQKASLNVQQTSTGKNSPNFCTTSGSISNIHIGDICITNDAEEKRKKKHRQP